MIGNFSKNVVTLGLPKIIKRVAKEYKPKFVIHKKVKLVEAVEPKPFLQEAMDGTEDFTFPRISDTCHFAIDSPPLWNIPSPSSSSPATDQDARKAKVMDDDDDKYEKDEDTMDLLWENFNEDVYSTSASATSSSTELGNDWRVYPEQTVELRCGSEALTMVKSNGSVIASNSCKPATLVLLKLLKKLLSLTKPTTPTSKVC